MQFYAKKKKKTSQSEKWTILQRPGGGHGHPLQYSCPENSMDRGAWRATVHEVAKSWTQLSDPTFTHTRSD